MSDLPGYHLLDRLRDIGETREFNRRIIRGKSRRGIYCGHAWGWKGATFCNRGRFTCLHFGQHRDQEGERW